MARKKQLTQIEQFRADRADPKNYQDPYANVKGKERTGFTVDDLPTKSQYDTYNKVTARGVQAAEYAMNMHNADYKKKQTTNPFSNPYVPEGVEYTPPDGRKTTTKGWLDYVGNMFQDLTGANRTTPQGMTNYGGVNVEDRIAQQWSDYIQSMYPGSFDDYQKNVGGFYGVEPGKVEDANKPTTSSYKNPNGVRIDPILEKLPDTDLTEKPLEKLPDTDLTNKPLEKLPDYVNQQPTTGYDWKSLQQQASDAAAGLTGQMAGSYEEIKRRIADSNGASYGMDEIAKPMEHPSNVPTAQNPQPPEVPIEDKKPYELTDEELDEMISRDGPEAVITQNEYYDTVLRNVQNANGMPVNLNMIREDLMDEDEPYLASFAKSMGIDPEDNAEYIADTVMQIAQNGMQAGTGSVYTAEK